MDDASHGRCDHPLQEQHIISISGPGPRNISPTFQTSAVMGDMTSKAHCRIVKLELLLASEAGKPLALTEAPTTNHPSPPRIVADILRPSRI